MKAIFQKSSTELYKKLRHWRQHTPADQISNSTMNIIVSQPIFKLWWAFILEDCFPSLYLLLSANNNDTNALL